LVALSCTTKNSSAARAGAAKLTARAAAKSNFAFYRQWRLQDEGRGRESDEDHESLRNALNKLTRANRGPPSWGVPLFINNEDARKFCALMIL
jgi:hypothetical protein